MKEVCKICNKLLTSKSWCGFTNHLRLHGLSSQEYYDKYIGENKSGKCLKCGEPTKFINISKGYKKYCSVICKNNLDDNIFSVKCAICNENYYQIQNLTSHLNKNDINIIEYYKKYIGEEGKCCVCNKTTNFISLARGYNKHCSTKCGLLGEKNYKLYRKRSKRIINVVNGTLLDLNSQDRVIVKCSECNIEFETTFYMIKNRDIDYCKSCIGKLNYNHKLWNKIRNSEYYHKNVSDGMKNYYKVKDIEEYELKRKRSKRVLKRLDGKDLKEFLPANIRLGVFVKCKNCGKIYKSNAFAVLSRNEDICVSCSIYKGWQKIRKKDFESKWKLYSKIVRLMTERNYKKYKFILNPLNLKRSMQDYNLDHKFSIFDGYKYNILPYVISHPFNLQIITKNENAKKYFHSSLTVDELFEGVENGI